MCNKKYFVYVPVLSIECAIFIKHACIKTYFPLFFAVKNIALNFELAQKHALVIGEGRRQPPIFL
jgi:hypothetical protein